MGAWRPCSRLEGDTYAETEILEPIDAVTEQVGAVRCVAVEHRHVESKAHVGSREDRNTHLGREVEPPRIGVLFVDVIVGGDLCPRSTEFEAGIGLEQAIFEEDVTARNTKWQLEDGMLLAGSQRLIAGQVERLAGQLLEIGLVVQKTTDGNLVGQEITSFDLHTPTREVVGKVISDRHTHLPIDVEIGVGDNLCPSTRRGHKEQHGKGCQGDMK